MSIEDTLYAPIHQKSWLDICRDISDWIDNHRRPERNLWSITRYRPARTLSLVAFMEAYRDKGLRAFWMLKYPDSLIPQLFTFTGDLAMPDVSGGMPIPVFYELSSRGRQVHSIEDMNLVLNTYTHYYIFETELDALAGVSSLLRYFP